MADKVIIGDDKDFSKIIDDEKPDIIVLGYDQQLPQNTEKKIKKYGIRIIRIDKHGDYSSKKV